MNAKVTTASATPISWKADLILLLVTLLAASGWIFSRESLQGIPPLFFLAIRFLGAAAVLGVSAPRLFTHIQPRQWRAGIPSALCFAAALTIWIHALLLTRHVGVGAFITSFAIVLVPLVGWLLYRTRPLPAHLWSLPVSVAGLACLGVGQQFEADPSYSLFLIAAILFAIHFTLTAHAVRSLPALPLTTLQLSTTGTVALMLALSQEEWPAVISLDLWCWIIASLFLATAMRFFLQTYAQGLSSANHAAVILTLEPVFTASLAALWFSETLTPWQWAGCSALFAGLIIARSGQIRLWLKSMKRQ